MSFQFVEFGAFTEAERATFFAPTKAVTMPGEDRGRSEASAPMPVPQFRDNVLFFKQDDFSELNTSTMTMITTAPVNLP